MIALGSDIDGLLGLSQMPGTPKITPMVPGAPGHGEGHNSRHAADRRRGDRGQGT